MKNQWSDEDASLFVALYAEKWGEDLALRTYASRLVGAEESLVLHGGGNTSVKGFVTNLLGEQIPAIYVKASGCDLANIEPEGQSAVDLEFLKRLRVLEDLSDDAMADEFRAHLFNPHAATPSIETLAHAFLPHKFIDHTHADAVLALTNQAEAAMRAREALGEDVILLDYVKPGFKLAKAVATAYESQQDAKSMVWMRHGLVTWGATARESYEATIEVVSRAERYLAQHASKPLVVQVSTPPTQAEQRLVAVAPLVRGLLAEPSGNADRPYLRVILQSLTDRATLNFVDSDRGKQIALSPPLTSDHLIRTKALPLWVDSPAYENPTRLRQQLTTALEEYKTAYTAYVERNSSRLPEGLRRFDPLPRVLLLPGLGALCAGRNVHEARIARDITAHTLAVKTQIAAMGTYEGLSESHLFEMEYHTLQHAKLGAREELPLARAVAVITGAAGAIGSAIAQGLLENGCHVAVTDLAGQPLLNLVADLKENFGERVTGVAMDVTDAASVAGGFETITKTWGGVDLVIVNAGIALVSSLAEMKLEAFQKLERVNTEGTLLTLAEAGRHFKYQGTGGDIVAVSTKNVFAPGAKFGAYSATKAASHQLARIASLEMAEIGVRVNMVSPDAVFSHGSRRSGLWAEVGPDRMRARGLDEKGLEEYYQNRNLLKARVTAQHVANAVLFFATRQTPTTGATIPVDGGLPDSTPR
ncbi:MAG: bifunctional aldolase/short-chain dehydrogenase [Terriglobia bacterium]|jgi:rhamnose utilization protein RhaD (predicted bifunctional aldolase and dehydrogenase)/NAD(P)-dependent dehydrogenase (short-subunit alcohol dehydrogenase family)